MHRHIGSACMQASADAHSLKAHSYLINPTQHPVYCLSSCSCHPTLTSNRAGNGQTSRDTYGNLQDLKTVLRTSESLRTGTHWCPCMAVPRSPHLTTQRLMASPSTSATSKGAWQTSCQRTSSGELRLGPKSPV